MKYNHHVLNTSTLMNEMSLYQISSSDMQMIITHQAMHMMYCVQIQLFPQIRAIFHGINVFTEALKTVI